MGGNEAFGNYPAQLANTPQLGQPAAAPKQDPRFNYNQYGVAYGWNPPERQHPLQRLLGQPRAGSNMPNMGYVPQPALWDNPQASTNTPQGMAPDSIPTGAAGVGQYHGLGPGGEGSDYYGYPDFLTNASTKFPPPPWTLGGQPYKML